MQVARLEASPRAHTFRLTTESLLLTFAAFAVLAPAVTTVIAAMMLALRGGSARCFALRARGGIGRRRRGVVFFVHPTESRKPPATRMVRQRVMVFSSRASGNGIARAHVPPSYEAQSSAD